MISQRAVVFATLAFVCVGSRAAAQYNPYVYSNPYPVHPYYFAYPAPMYGHAPQPYPSYAMPFASPRPATACVPPLPATIASPVPPPMFPPRFVAPEAIQPVKHAGQVQPAIEPAPAAAKEPSDPQVIQAQAPPVDIPGTVGGPTTLPAPVANPSYWSFGSGTYLIQPYFESNPAYRLHRRVGPDNLENTYQNFRHDVGAAPLAWIGYTGAGGFGIRARWFQFEQDAYESIVKDDSFIRVFHAKPLDLDVDFGTKRGSVFEFGSNLRVDVWDLEVTKLIDGPNWALLIAAGVRYAHMSQDYRAFGPRSETDLLISSGHNFNGMGPTLALEAKRGIFDTRFSWYVNARASILFGTGKQSAIELVTDRATGALVHSTFNFAQQADVLPIGDLELGLEYGRNFGAIGAFIQMGFMGQIWVGGGNAANTTVTGEVAQNTSDFGFLGAALRFGLDF